MAEHLRRQRLKALNRLLVIAGVFVLGFSAPSATAQTPFLEDTPFEPTDADVFFYQCAGREEPLAKTVIFMQVDKPDLVALYVSKNESLTGADGVSFKDGAWKMTDGEQHIGNAERLKKYMRGLAFRLVTASQLRELIRTQPTETCAPVED